MVHVVLWCVAVVHVVLWCVAVVALFRCGVVCCCGGVVLCYGACIEWCCAVVVCWGAYKVGAVHWYWCRGLMLVVSVIPVVVIS